MVDRLSNRLIYELKKQNILISGCEEQYSYVILSFIEKSITVVSLMIIAFAVGRFFDVAIFLAVLFRLRRHTGGYHAASFLECYIFSFLTIVAFIPASVFLHKHKMMQGLLVIISFVIITGIGVVNHPNIHMSFLELVAAKRKARITVKIVFFVNAICFCFLGNAMKSSPKLCVNCL